MGAKEKKETGNLKGKVESLHPTMVSLPVPGHLAERRKAAVGEKKLIFMVFPRGREVGRNEARPLRTTFPL